MSDDKENEEGSCFKSEEELLQENCDHVCKFVETLALTEVGELSEQSRGKLAKAQKRLKEFLALDAELPNSLVAAAHFKLANLYESQQNWLAVNEHAQYVIDHSPLAYDKERAVDLIELAKKEILIKKSLNEN